MIYWHLVVGNPENDSWRSQCRIVTLYKTPHEDRDERSRVLRLTMIIDRKDGLTVSEMKKGSYSLYYNNCLVGTGTRTDDFRARVGDTTSILISVYPDNQDAIHTIEFRFDMDNIKSSVLEGGEMIRYKLALSAFFPETPRCRHQLQRVKMTPEGYVPSGVVVYSGGGGGASSPPAGSSRSPDAFEPSASRRTNRRGGVAVRRREEQRRDREHQFVRQGTKRSGRSRSRSRSHSRDRKHRRAESPAHASEQGEITSEAPAPVPAQEQEQERGRSRSPVSDYSSGGE